MLAYFYVLDPCCLTRSRLLPCFVHSVGLCLLAIGTTWLFGHIRPSYGLFGCNHCENVSPWCWFARCIPSSTPCDDLLALLALCHPVWLSLFLCIFAHLPICSCMRLYVCLFVSSSLVPTISYGFTLVLDTRDPESLLETLLDGSILQSHWTMDARSKPTFCPLRTPPFRAGPIGDATDAIAQGPQIKEGLHL